MQQWQPIAPSPCPLAIHPNACIMLWCYMLGSRMSRSCCAIWTLLPQNTTQSLHTIYFRCCLTHAAASMARIRPCRTGRASEAGPCWSLPLLGTSRPANHYVALTSIFYTEFSRQIETTRQKPWAPSNHDPSSPRVMIRTAVLTMLLSR